MTGITILPLGVGDAFSALYYSSCLAVHSQGCWLLVDCPHPIRKILREGSYAAGTPLDLEHITTAIITHLHSDHCSGVEGYGFYNRYLLGRKASLLAHPTVAATIWPRHLSAGMEWSISESDLPPKQRTLEDFFDLQYLQEEGVVEVGPFRVECRPTRHSVPTYALRLHAGGRTLGYSADTAFDPSLIEWLATADLVIHETSNGSMHTPYHCLAALPAELRRKMRLIHYPDTFDLASSVIECLRQGQCVTV